MTSAKVSQKYQIVIPRVVRRQMGIHTGAKVSIYPIDQERALLVKEPTDRIAALKGLGKNLWKKLGGADHYIKQERSSWNDRS